MNEAKRYIIEKTCREFAHCSHASTNGKFECRHLGPDRIYEALTSHLGCHFCIIGGKKHYVRIVENRINEGTGLEYKIFIIPARINPRSESLLAKLNLVSRIYHIR